MRRTTLARRVDGVYESCDDSTRQYFDGWEYPES